MAILSERQAKEILRQQSGTHLPIGLEARGDPPHIGKELAWLRDNIRKAGTTKTTIDDVHITPKLAEAAMFLRSKKNRDIDRKWVERLKVILIEGRFHDFEALIFDWEGDFRQGQHRATAIMETGIGVTMSVAFDAITIGPSHRRLVHGTVKDLVVSIQTIGLKTPITVRRDPEDQDSFILVTGRHRIAAYRRLGRIEIEAELQVETGNERRDKREAKLWELAENLHRAELTAIQRNLGVGEWVKLKAEQIEKEQKEQRRVSGVAGRKLPEGRPESGASAAARELGIAERTARRAVYITNNLNKAAQKEAERLGLDDNLKALEGAAGVGGDDEQIRFLHRFLKRQQDKEAQRKAAKERKAQREAMPPPMPAAAPPSQGAPPRQATAQEAFDRWYWSLEIDMRTEVLIWLLGLDTEAYVAELKKTAELVRKDRAALH